MFTILGLGIVCFIVAFVLIMRDGIDCFEDFLFSLLFGFLWGIIGVGAGLIISLVIPADKHIVTYSNEIVTLQDNNALEGTFFLGSGGFGNDMYYSFYYKTEDGGFKSKTLDSDFVTIYYDENPRYEVNVEETTDAFINKFSICASCGGKERKLFVPEGTIKENYNLDAQ